DDAFVPGHGFSHDIENRLEPSHSQLGITQAVDKTCRIADVREQDCQSLTLSAFGAQGSQNLLPRRIDGLRSGWFQGSTASTEEACRGSIEVMTGTTLNSESSPAALAIFVGRLILPTATQTLHQWPRPSIPRGLQLISVLKNLFTNQFYAALQQRTT